ncbi:hypothetical protein I6F21_14205 [Bradyrhizobium sp. NBAIM03]|uniref:hypothetical protein n=1 Tax=Bradyrhizobium sp. NBAIM03 TaxID=2793816 RepID=UPI001CD2FA19|nr:hypothetical protein [Bradyrhizobium sp. NBAIM03]MCA1533715.1 hypothetical protein [Bradyrhizobium sp. NBAIM03]
MLRPPSRPHANRMRRQAHPGPDAAARKREQRRLAQRDYRRRFDDGLIVVPVEIDGLDGDVVEMLVRNRWLLDDERCDRRKIGAALSAFVAEATRS